nr:hypothetical protein [Kofleriaceae bacterium]
MDTPFGLRRYLLLSFPEVLAASVSMTTPQSLTLRYVASPDGLPEHEVLCEWVKQNKTAGIAVTVQRVPEIAPEHLPAAQLQGFTIPQDVAEDVAINLEGIYAVMRRRWPDDFVRFDDGPGRVNLVVTAATTADTRLAMQREVSLLLHGVAVTAQVDATNAIRTHVRSRAELVLADDHQRMDALCNDAVAGRYEPPPLAEGAYAYVPLKPTSLFCHLAISGRVYVEVPRTVEEMQTRHGVPWVDLLDTMATGRVVPVFRLPARMYEAGMIDTVLDAGGTYILPGDNRLRELAAFTRELPAVGLASQLDDQWRATHAAVKQHAGSAHLRPFFDAIAQAAARARLVARRDDFMVKTWSPLALAINDIFQVFGHGRRDLEFTNAIDIMTGAQGCGTLPILPAGDLLGQYVQVLYGMPSNTNQTQATAPTELVHEPAVVAKIVLERVGGISLRQFAESFEGPAIKAMRKLMNSPRLKDADVSQTVADFERELHDFNGRRKKLGRVNLGVDGALALASLSSGWGLVAVAAGAIVKQLIARSVLSDEQVATLLRMPREAAYLARIEAAIKDT